MSNDKMREEFEFAFRNSGVISGATPYALDSMLERGSDGEYRSIRVHGAWWAWQASRSTIEVNLPRRYDMQAGYGFLVFQVAEPNGEWMNSEDVLAAIESLGLKVKS